MGDHGTEQLAPQCVLHSLCCASAADICNFDTFLTLAALSLGSGKRFGARFRPYVAHEAKSVSSALLHEVSQTWPIDVAATASHKFRETAKGTGDFNMLYMFNHFVVERSREAMLWAWVVGKLGKLDDGWTKEEADRAWIEVGGGPEQDSVEVRTAWRETLEKGRVDANLRKSGLVKPGVTTYSFCQSPFPFA